MLAYCRVKVFSKKTNLSHVSVKKTVVPPVSLTKGGRGPASVAQVLEADIHLAFSGRKRSTAMELDSIFLGLVLTVC